MEEEEGDDGGGGRWRRKRKMEEDGEGRWGGGGGWRRKRKMEEEDRVGRWRRKLGKRRSFNVGLRRNVRRRLDFRKFRRVSSPKRIGAFVTTFRLVTETVVNNG